MNVALATGSIGRPGVAFVWAAWEGYARLRYPRRTSGSLRRQATDRGKGGVHHIWDCDHYKTTLNAHQFKQVYKKPFDMVKIP